MTTTLEGAPTWLELATFDQEVSLPFYSGMFGWTADDPIDGLGDYRMLRLNGFLVGGLVPATSVDGWHVFLHTTDAVETAAKVELAGGKIDELPTPMLELGVRDELIDPTGAWVGGWQPGTLAGLELQGAPGAAVWYELHTRDFAAAVPFYQEAFAWSVEPLSDTDEFRMVTFPAGAGEDALAGIYDSAREELEQDSHWQVYFAVDDVDASAAKAEELGGLVVTGPEDSPYGRLAHVMDPMGVPFSIMKPAA